MQKLSQEYLLDIAFKLSLDREELLIKKYKEYNEQLDNKELKSIMKEFKKGSREHVKLIKDMMIKLNLKN